MAALTVLERYAATPDISSAFNKYLEQTSFEGTNNLRPILYKPSITVYFESG